MGYAWPTTRFYIVGLCTQCLYFFVATVCDFLPQGRVIRVIILLRSADILGTQRSILHTVLSIG